jgi:hypothetical protein
MKHLKYASEILIKKYIKTLEKVIAKHMQVTDNTLATYM